MSNYVICIGGKKRAGKDTVADIICKITKAKKVSLAGPMKDIIADMLHISVPALEELKNNPDKPHRGYLQRLGQKAKEYFGETCWTDYTRRVIENIPGDTIAIISDFRYPIETQEGDITINVVNSKLPEDIDTHSSENSLNKFAFTYTIYNEGSLKDLEYSVRGLVAKLISEGKLP